MKPARGTMRVFDDRAALAQGAADLLLKRARASTGPFVVGMSGGSTPKPMPVELAALERQPPGAWPRLTLAL